MSTTEEKINSSEQVEEKKVFYQVKPVNYKSLFFNFIFLFVIGFGLGYLLFPVADISTRHFSNLKDRRFIQHQFLNIFRSVRKEELIKIDRIHRPTPEEFHKYVNSHTPVIITGVMENWPSFKNWTDDYINNKIGHIQTMVETSKTNKFYGGSKLRKIYIKTFLDVYTNPNRKTNFYLAESDIAKYPQLVPDIPESPYFAPKHWLKDITQFWIAAGGQTTPIHNDENENLLCQIDGARTITLLSGFQNDLMYIKKENPVYPRVNPANFTLKEFPLYKFNTQFKVTLTKGEIVYIPACWYHLVNSHPGRSLAVNYWYSPTSKSGFYTYITAKALEWRNANFWSLEKPKKFRKLPRDDDDDEGGDDDEEED